MAIDQIQIEKAHSEKSILTEDLMIESDTGGIRLHLRHKRREVENGFSAQKTLLLMHGATYSSGSLFDVPFAGISLLDYLAGHGYDVYALDVRGYGRSTRPAEMEEAPENNPPIVTTEVAVRDLTSAVDFILKHNGIAQLNLLGMSWGGSVSGMYTSQNNSKIRKLILVAPQWVTSKPPRIDSGGRLGAYREIFVPAALERWMDGVPKEKQRELLPEGWFEQWAKATIADDPWAFNSSYEVVRAPSGAVADVREYWAAGRPLYNPGDITVPVLLIHAEWDRDVPLDLAEAYFRALRKSPDRHWLEIAEGTHLVLLESKRTIAMRAVVSFLQEEKLVSESISRPEALGTGVER